MQKDLYKLLGLDKLALPEDIKRAYREKAKENHPDIGGDPKTMSDLNMAYDILSDEEKKKLYDEGKSTNTDYSAIARQELSGLFSATIDNPQIPPEFDMKRYLTDNIIQNIHRTKDMISNSKHAMNKFEKIKKKIKGREEFIHVLNDKITQLRDSIYKFERAITINELMLGLLKDFEYEFENISDQLGFFIRR